MRFLSITEIVDAMEIVGSHIVGSPCGDHTKMLRIESLPCNRKSYLWTPTKMPVPSV